jgi:hypothetical protein
MYPIGDPLTTGGWCKTDTGIVPIEKQINRDLYKNAAAVICLTKWHENQLRSNLEGNFENIGINQKNIMLTKSRS